MKRQLKFRGWDGENMLDPQDLTQSGAYWNWLGKNDVVLMQYTNVQDKNGKDIYEGDIIKFTAYDTDGEPFTCFEMVTEINYDGCHPLNRDDARDSYGLKCRFIYAEDVRNCEVVGNIYQNANLLEGQA